MTPFQRARIEAQRLREQYFPEEATSGICSSRLIEVIVSEEAEDIEISLASPTDAVLGGADALLIREYQQIVVRNDISAAEIAFLIAHEIGHWKIHSENDDSCHKVVDSTLTPEGGETFGSQKVEAYGARERAELQANLFARELLLPRDVATSLYKAGMGCRDIHQKLGLPLELVRLQLLDGLLLPPPQLSLEPTKELFSPTDEQDAAAQSTSQTSLVVAGPGTGKTATLLLRIKHLLNQGVKPSEILVLTFSNRAARELVDRLLYLGVNDAHEIWVGTFHAFGLEFLRKNHDQFGLRSNFGVADKLAQIAVLEPHIYGMSLEAFNPLGDPLDLLNDVVTTIQRAKDELADPVSFAKAVDASAANTTSEILTKQRDLVKLYRTYDSAIRASGSLVDLGDLVMLPAKALNDDYERFNASVGQFQHILVDEYQDVNRASAELVKALAAHAKSLWVVGDARQAIYRFRGASMRNVLRFQDDFPNYHQFSLNENRRSYEEIIKVFEHTGRNKNPLQGVLPLDDILPARGTSGVKPVHVTCKDEDTVVGEVVARIKTLHRQGVSYRDQVVITSTNKTCDLIADVLNASGVPALHLGNIFERPEIKDLLTLLQLFVDRSGSGLIRVSQFPGFGIHNEDVDMLVNLLRETRPEPLSWLNQPPPGLSESSYAAIACWRTILEGLSATQSPWEVLCTLLLDRTTFLSPHLSGDSMPDITRRMAIWQFMYYLRAPDGCNHFQTVASFSRRLGRQLRLREDYGLRIPPPEANCLDAVAVLTIHGSKGLEYEAVHLMDTDAYHFRASKDSTLLPSALLASVAPVENFEAESEASNKLYVALSRAQRYLLIYESTGHYNAECVTAVKEAAHLFEQQEGTHKHSRQGGADLLAANAVLPPVDMSGLIVYRLCPRRFYYDYIRRLTPDVGLHPASRIETAVIHDLFTPQSANPSNISSNEVTRVLSSLDVDATSLSYLKTYADKLFAHGHRWLGMSSGMSPDPIRFSFQGMELQISPHRVISSGKTTRLGFIRAQPPSHKALQLKQLRWVLKQLANSYRGLYFSGEILTLSTGESLSVAPYTRLTNDVFASSAQQLFEGDFSANTGCQACARCRHFAYCPA